MRDGFRFLLADEDIPRCGLDLELEPAALALINKLLDLRPVAEKARGIGSPETGQFYPPLSAQNAPEIDKITQKGTAQNGCDIIGLQDRADLGVHPGGCRADHGRHVVWTASGHQAVEGNRVNPNIQHRAAGESWIPEPAARIERRPKPEIGPDLENLTDPSVVNPVPGCPDCRQKGRPERFHEIDIRVPRGGNQGLAFARCRRQRLFAQDRLAGLDRQTGMFKVEAVGGGHVDRVHIGIAHEVLIRPMKLRDPEFAGKGLRPATITGRHRMKAGTRRMTDIGRKLPRDFSSPENSPSDLFHHAPLLI